MNRQRRTLEDQIKAVKRELAALGDLRPGSLSQQYNVCGTPGCRCKAAIPRKHGPYYQLNYMRKGRSGTRFVKKEELVAVQAAVKNYARLRTLVDRWIDLATELFELKLKLRPLDGKPATKRA
jgi:hypothetical protein